MKNLMRKAVCRGIAVVLVLSFSQAIAQNAIFQSTDALLTRAMEAEAPLLSPGNYADAMKDYAKAKDYAGRGRTDKAQAELKDVQAALNKAINASNLGKVNFASTLKARDLAIAAEASIYEAGLWDKAETQFSLAASSLESGNVNSANDKALKAKNLYSNAELEAIKTAIVGEARDLIAMADKNKVDREAPITLDKAKAAVAQAEADLNKSRYNTEGPIGLAVEAEYEALHASYIADQLRRVDDKEVTGEQLMLEWEKPLQAIATALDVSTDMSAGYGKSADASVGMANSLIDANVEMLGLIALLEIEVGGLQEEVGGQEMIVQETKRLQAQLAEVEALFTVQQARVVREGNDLLLRLVGLSFPTGQSVIETQYFGLLKKVQDAIEIYPNAPIVIEGHTDSVGSDAVNMKLSQDRANSVREYLVANLGLPESRISAVGIGKNKPIASNETPEGRAQNRRIDVVIVDARARKGN